MYLLDVPIRYLKYFCVLFVLLVLFVYAVSFVAMLHLHLWWFYYWYCSVWSVICCRACPPLDLHAHPQCTMCTMCTMCTAHGTVHRCHLIHHLQSHQSPTPVLSGHYKGAAKEVFLKERAKRTQKEAPVFMNRSTQFTKDWKTGALLIFGQFILKWAKRRRTIKL